MVAHVLRLRLDLLFGALRGGSERAARVIVVLIALGLACVTAGWAMLSLRDAAPEVVLAVTVLSGAAVTFGFALAPLIGAADDPLDPRRFSLFGLPTRRLALVLALAGMISVPVAALVAVAVCAALVWTSLGATWTASIVGIVLGVLTCVLLARVCMAVATLFLRERRSRELSGLFVIAVLVVVVPAGVFLSSLEWGRRCRASSTRRSACWR
ncbi:hypothetical protein [Microbacterium hominis]|uniref:hypothetical protein n=1 Tax=Microbacterium hominis TaxID=162426 RepID=UPI0020B7DF74|nr:hypothetical protein [Microbacterium hominis]